MLRWRAVALPTCTISFVGRSGIRHSVEATAESVYEAAALDVSGAEEQGWADAIAPGTELDMALREPASSHRITVQQIHRWYDGIAASSDETLKKRTRGQ